MSYRNTARRVRDETLPFGVRLRYFKNCLERYCPPGWGVSYEYLLRHDGPFESDAPALLRALDRLTASRDAWLAGADRHRGEWLWFGEERRAALFALDHEVRVRGAWEPELAPPAERCLASSGALDPADRALLARLRAEVDQYRRRDFWAAEPDWPRWHRSSDVLRLLVHIRNAADARD